MIRNKRNDTEVTETQGAQRSAPHTWEFDLDKNVSSGKSWDRREGSRLPFHSKGSRLEVCLVGEG